MISLLTVVTGDTDFLLWILQRLQCGYFLRFFRRVEQAELLVPVVKDVRPLLAALSELGTLEIQDDLPEPLDLLILFPALFSERINGALQHGILLPDFRKNLQEKLRLFHAAFTTLHVYLIRHAGDKILLVFLTFSENH